MGKGIDAARPHAPLHAAVLDDLKDQLILCLVRRLNGKVSLPVAEVDDTGGLLLLMSIENGSFNLEIRKKQ